MREKGQVVDGHMDVRGSEAGVSANHAQPDQRREPHTRWCGKPPRKGLAQHVQWSLTGRGAAPNRKDNVPRGQREESCTGFASRTHQQRGDDAR